MKTVPGLLPKPAHRRAKNMPPSSTNPSYSSPAFRSPEHTAGLTSPALPNAQQPGKQSSPYHELTILSLHLLLPCAARAWHWCLLFSVRSLQEPSFCHDRFPSDLSMTKDIIKRPSWASVSLLLVGLDEQNQHLIKSFDPVVSPTSDWKVCGSPYPRKGNSR